MLLGSAQDFVNEHATSCIHTHTYIDAREHSSAELAQDLHRLDQEPEEYLSYFWCMDGPLQDFELYQKRLRLLSAVQQVDG